MTKPWKKFIHGFVISGSQSAGSCTITSRIHCEALLLRHHSLNPGFHPLNYIGVSKSCCYPCYALFHAHDKSVGPEQPKYFTQGCHSRLYPQWILPGRGTMDSSIRS
ncbi:hypothetical protein DFH29DRAFT_232991 [Suillus ampliporus]|nr:hypothetical protein DFH29DRAFT_232991 [Suillus ampliporus]